MIAAGASEGWLVIGSNSKQRMPWKKALQYPDRIATAPETWPCRGNAMKAELFILQVCEFLDDGDGLYRLHQPSLHLSRLPGVVVVDCHFYHRYLPSLIAAADVLVLPFFHNWDYFSLIERRRAACCGLPR